jgi:broad-specificity NMP kinase
MSSAATTPIPDQPELTITIAGRPGTGKSTLALTLAMLLEKLGIEVTAINDEVTEEQQAFLTENLKANLAAIAARQPRISINMGQLERDKVKLILPGGA